MQAPAETQNTAYLCHCPFHIRDRAQCPRDEHVIDGFVSQRQILTVEADELDRYPARGHPSGGELASARRGIHRQYTSDFSWVVRHVSARPEAHLQNFAGQPRGDAGAGLLERTPQGKIDEAGKYPVVVATHDQHAWRPERTIILARVPASDVARSQEPMKSAISRF